MNKNGLIFPMCSSMTVHRGLEIIRNDWVTVRGVNHWTSRSVVRFEKNTSKVIVQSNQVLAGDSKIQKLQIVKPLCRVIELHIGKMRPFLFITCLVHSLGPPISSKRSNYDISFSYLHSLLSIPRWTTGKNIDELTQNIHVTTCDYIAIICISSFYNGRLYTLPS